MILSIFLILTFIGVVSFFNRRNKFLNVIAMYFFSIVLIMFVSVLYVSRLSNYTFPLQVDYDFYMWLSKLRIHINTLVIICNMSIGLFMFSTLYLIKLIKGYGKRFLVITSIVIIGEFLYTNSPSFLWSMYLKINSSAGKSDFYNYIVIFLSNFNISLIVLHCILPFAYLGMYYKNTKIPLKKKNAITYMCCLGVMEILIYAIFVKGPFAEFMFYNLDMLGFPEQSATNYSYLSVPLISSVMIVFILFMVTFFKPFNSLVLIRKKEMIRNTRIMNKNIRMILHIYKNAFLGIEKKTQIGKLLLEDNDIDKAKKNLDDIQTRSLQSVKKIEHMLDILREPAMLYEEVVLSSCIYKAVSKFNFGSKISLATEKMLDDIIVLADDEHITEIFVNMFTNSCEAIAQKGNKDGRIVVSMDAEEDMVMVNIYDNGCGIKKEHFKEVFAPFFSTKKSSDCGGVGLNYVERVVKNHKGEIYVKSKENEYTLFQIVLPILRRE